MTKRKQQGPEAPPALTKPREAAAQRIEDVIAEGETLRDVRPQTPAELKQYEHNAKIWMDYCRDLLKSLFTTDAIAQEHDVAAWRTWIIDSSWLEEAQYCESSPRGR